MKAKKRIISVGVQSAQEMDRAAVRAWKRAERGLSADGPVNQLHFEDMATLLKYLSPRRMELLQKLRTIGATNTRRLAQALNRDYKNVYTDVADLLHIGLIEENKDRKLFVPWDEIAANFSLLGKVI